MAIVDEEWKEKVIGLGYYQTEPEDRTAGQPAFLIEDKYQNQGVGRALARQVIVRARTNGIQVLDALIHPANRRMMYLIEKSGLPFKAKLAYGACEVRIALQDAEVDAGNIDRPEPKHPRRLPTL